MGYSVVLIKSVDVKHTWSDHTRFAALNRAIALANLHSCEYYLNGTTYYVDAIDYYQRVALRRLAAFGV